MQSRQSRLTRNLKWVSGSLASPRVIPKVIPKTGLPVHDPPLPAREEAIYYLHIAAEVEHALMVQYLYAAFSLGGPQVPDKHQSDVKRWRNTILGIAREEMGHLSTVQNMLQLLGGPLSFEREDFPIPPDLYPFSFHLEPLTQESLAKYVVAEMPPLDTFKKEDEKIEMVQIIQIAQGGNKNRPIDRVGILYATAIDLLDQVITSDFNADSVRYQARADEWGLNYPGMLILHAGNRADAKTALSEVAEQGEGNTDASAPGKEDELSHFERFLKVYRQFPKDSSWLPARPVPVDPTTEERKLGSITQPQARLWAQLFNQRYRLLLMYLSHAFYTEGRETGFANARGLLVSWSFGEMYNLRSIADILTTLPQHEKGGLDHVAGPPFEMPYSLSLPEREADRWRQHRDIITASSQLIENLCDSATDSQKIYLNGLNKLDAASLETMITIIAG